MSVPIVIKGPCLIQYGATKFWSTDGVEVDLTSKTFNIPTDAFGVVDERLMDAYYTITLTPLTTLLPVPLNLIASIVNSPAGTPLFGASPTSLIIKPLLAGQKGLTFHRAALTKLPTMTLSTVKPLWGSLTFTAIRNDVPTEADSLVTELDYATITDRPDHNSICTIPWSAYWDQLTPPVGEAEQEYEEDNPWVGFDTEAGWTLDFNLSTSEDRTDACGLVGMTITDTGVVAKCTPLSITEAQLLASLRQSGSGVTRGQTLRNPSYARKLRLQALTSNLRITLDEAALVGGKAAWATSKNRVGEVEFHALRRFASGAQADLFKFEDLE